MVTNFVPRFFVDTFDLAASLRRHVGLFDDGTPRILPIRAPRKGTEEAAESLVWCPVIEKWVEMKNFLGRLKREAEAISGPLDLGRIYIEMLDPGMTTPWATESGPYIERYARMHMALRTSPAALMICGAEALSLGQGWLIAVNVRAPTCAINLGQHPRVHLVLDVRKKDATDGVG